MPRLALLASLILAVVVYWAGLSGPFVFDDAQNLAAINDWLQGRIGWVAVVFGNGSGLFGRPLSMASFVANVALLGPESWGLKLGNLFIHLINGVLVFVLFGSLTRQGGLTRDAKRENGWAAWFGAAIWLLHPLLVSTVLYVVQRMAMLSALFTLLALIAYLHGRTTLHSRPTRARILLLLALPGFSTLAVLSKENGVLVLPLCALIELFVFVPAVGMKRSWKSRLVVVMGLVVPAVIAIGLVAFQAPMVVSGYLNRPFTLEQRLLTETRVLWDYARAYIAPNGPRMGLYHDDFVVSTGLFAPATTAFAIAAWLGLVAFAWRMRRAVPGFALGIGIFLVCHALESSIFPLLIYFEHRNYLATTGLAWALVSLATFTIATLQSQRRIIPAAGAAIVILLSVATFARAHVWSNRESLLQQSLVFHPASRWLRSDLILNAMQKNPPAISEARTHADYMIADSDPLTKRYGAIERVLIDCAAGGSADRNLVDLMFNGPSEPIEADLLLAFDSLADGIARQPCSGLSPGQLADGLVQLLDRTRLPVGTLGVWRLRYRAANLYAAVDRIEDAISQSELAVAGGNAQPQAMLFLAGLYLENGDIQKASLELDKAEAALGANEVFGHQIVAKYRARILEHQN